MAEARKKRFEEDGSAITFTDFNPIHEKILQNLKERSEETVQEKVIGFKNWLDGVWEDLNL